jgi:GAF domain-containing protein
MRSFLLPGPARLKLRRLLDEAIAGQDAAKGNVQWFGQRGALQIVAQRGFNHDFLKRFEFVRPDDESACGRTMRSSGAVLIADVQRDRVFAPFRPIAAAAGFRAVQSVPLPGAAGNTVGVLSVHYADPLPFPEWRLSRLQSHAVPIADLLRQVIPQPAADH